MSNQREIICKGKKVSLVIPEKQDLEIYYRGLNNPEINVFLSKPEKIRTLEMEEKYFETECNTETRITFSIMENETKEIVGNICLGGISHFHKNASLGIGISNTQKHGKGYGTESLQLLLDYGFKVQGLRKVSLTCKGFNLKAKHIYEKVGFKEIGIQKQHYYVHGKYVDLVLMEIFKDEFYKINKLGINT